MAKRKPSPYVRISPLGYAVLGILLLIVIIGVAYVAWSVKLAAAEEAASATAPPDAVPTFTPPTAGQASAGPAATPTLPPLGTEIPSVTAEPTAVPTPTSNTSTVNGVQLPTQAEESAAVSGKLMNSGVVLRSGPGKGYDIIGRDYDEGTELKIYAQEGEYYKVQIVKENKYGYMAAKFIVKYGLLPGEEATPAPTLPQGLVQGTVSASVVAIRSKPDKDDAAAKLGQYPRDTVVWIYFKTGDFYYVKVVADGTLGYMYAEYVDNAGAVPSGTPVP